MTQKYYGTPEEHKAHIKVDAKLKKDAGGGACTAYAYRAHIADSEEKISMLDNRYTEWMIKATADYHGKETEQRKSEIKEQREALYKKLKKTRKKQEKESIQSELDRLLSDLWGMEDHISNKYMDADNREYKPSYFFRVTHNEAEYADVPYEDDGVTYYMREKVKEEEDVYDRIIEVVHDTQEKKGVSKNEFCISWNNETEQAVYGRDKVRGHIIAIKVKTDPERKGLHRDIDLNKPLKTYELYDSNCPDGPITFIGEREFRIGLELLVQRWCARDQKELDANCKKTGMRPVFVVYNSWRCQLKWYPQKPEQIEPEGYAPEPVEAPKKKTKAKETNVAVGQQVIQG